MTKTLLIILIFFVSCKKSEQEKWFEAKVINTSDLDCSKPVVKFLEKDSIEICSRTGLSALTYKTYSLEDKYNYRDNIILVKIGKPPEGWTGPPCTVSGTFFYDVWFSEVKQK
jgi:hypothetical protein